MTVKTHTFRLGRYAIDEADGLYGCCDVPGCDDNLGMIIMSGDTRRALNTARPRDDARRGRAGHVDARRDAGQDRVGVVAVGVEAGERQR